MNAGKRLIPIRDELRQQETPTSITADSISLIAIKAVTKAQEALTYLALSAETD